MVQFLQMAPEKEKIDIKEYFDSVAASRVHWRQRYAYYHREIERYVQFLIPQNSTVLEIGCFTGELLASLRPVRGLGLDFSQKMVAAAQKNFPTLDFQCGDWDALPDNETFDYIILSNILGYTDDLQQAFGRLKKLCRPRSRVVIVHYNHFWKPILKFGEIFRMRMKWPEKHWLSTQDIANILYLNDFEVVSQKELILLPVQIPVLSFLCNKILVHLPGFRQLALNYVLIARPREVRRPQEVSCSVIVPCRNEKGNIEQAVTRLPPMGAKTEIIFVEGHSKDGTLEECERVKLAYPDRDITVMVQRGEGKGNAVREGFAAAKNDCLMILDADLTVPPESLPKFFEALVAGKGEFINGSRLVYQMEKQAMQFLNMIANKMFSIILTYLLGQYLKDTLCGTKVLWRDDYERIADGRSYFGDFDPFGDFDLLFGAAKLNLKIIEIPVRYLERQYGMTQIRRFAHGWLLLKMTTFAMRKIKFI